MTNYDEIIDTLTRDELSALRSAASIELGYKDPGTIGIEPKPGLLSDYEYQALIDILESKVNEARALLKTRSYRVVVEKLIGE